jgi:hypothetical protein
MHEELYEEEDTCIYAEDDTFLSEVCQPFLNPFHFFFNMMNTTVQMDIFVSMHWCVQICVYVSMYTYPCVYVLVYNCSSVCICLGSPVARTHTHTHTHTQHTGTDSFGLRGPSGHGHSWRDFGPGQHLSGAYHD